jgi:hypothetical protein
MLEKKTAKSAEAKSKGKAKAAPGVKRTPRKTLVDEGGM